LNGLEAELHVYFLSLLKNFVKELMYELAI